MSSLEAKLLELVDRVDAGLTQYTPEAMDAVLLATRVDAFASILFNLFMVLVGLGLVLLARYFLIRHRRHIAELEAKKLSVLVEDGWQVIAVIVGALGAIVTLGGLVGALNVWSWVGLFNPQLAFVKRLIYGSGGFW